MKCGHVAQGIDMNTGAPVCVICAGIRDGSIEVEREVSGTDSLQGRRAKCSYGDSIVDSSWELPFFEYLPNKEFDRYYCGCWGWD